MHSLRCSPCFDQPLLDEHDAVLREGLAAIVNIHMSDTQWIQASTPVRNGGLGIRRAASLALPAFLASAAATSDLQCSILSRFQLSVDKEVATARTHWRSLIDTPTPLGPLESSRRAWDATLLARDLRSVEEAASSPLDRARLLTATAAHGSEWIFALPITACGLRLSNEAIRVAIGLRLGLSLCEPHPCPCGSVVDPRGLHGLSCKRSAGRSTRHQQLNDVIWRAPTSRHSSNQGTVRTDFGLRPAS